MVIESCDGRCECTFPSDIVEIAESIDEVRGIGCTSGRKPVNGGGDEGVGRGDGGVDSPKWLDFGNGDETFRSWLYEWDLSGDPVAFLTDDPSIPLVLPLTSPSLEIRGSSTLSRGELGWSRLAAKSERGERGEYREPLVVPISVGDFGLLELL